MKTPLITIILAAALSLGACGESSTEVQQADPPATNPPATPNGAPAKWDIDPDDEPTVGSKTFTALVTRIDCSAGKTGTVLEPVVEERDDEIVVTFSVEELPEGAYTCPSNDAVPYEVELDEPIGDRPLADGACSEGSASVAMACGTEQRWTPVLLAE